MQNNIQKFRKSFIAFEKPSILSESFENFDELELSYHSIFFAETLHKFSTHQCLQKGLRDFFLFHLDLELFAEIEKDLVSTHSFYTILLITQYLNKIKETPLSFMWTLLMRKRVQNFSKKIYTIW